VAISAKLPSDVSARGIGAPVGDGACREKADGQSEGIVEGSGGIMHLREVFGIALTVAFLPFGAAAQEKTIRDELVGAWALLSSDSIKPDGVRDPNYGPNPIGSAIFTANGRMSVQWMRTVNRPRFASGNRDSGTPEENKAVAQGVLSIFGSYSVDEKTKTINFSVEGSSFPNQEGTKGKWQVTSITDGFLVFDRPAATTSNARAGYATVENAWRKTK
jgi:Lipocalin-like domain